MMCVKLFELPKVNSNIIFEKLRDRIVYNNNGFIALDMEECSRCIISNAIKSIKIRASILNSYVFFRLRGNFEDQGYIIEKGMDSDGDVIKLKLQRGSELIEINANGLIYMSDINFSIIDGITRILQGVD